MGIPDKRSIFDRARRPTLWEQTTGISWARIILRGAPLHPGKPGLGNLLGTERRWSSSLPRLAGREFSLRFADLHNRSPRGKKLGETGLNRDKSPALPILFQPLSAHRGICLLSLREPIRVWLFKCQKQQKQSCGPSPGAQRGWGRGAGTRHRGPDPAPLVGLRGLRAPGEQGACPAGAEGQWHAARPRSPPPVGQQGGSADAKERSGAGQDRTGQGREGAAPAPPGAVSQRPPRAGVPLRVPPPARRAGAGGWPGLGPLFYRQSLQRWN